MPSFPTPLPRHAIFPSSDPRVAKVAFTGSGPTGRRVALAAAENLRPASMELGGKSALIVFGDADVEKAVEWAMVRGPGMPRVLVNRGQETGVSKAHIDLCRLGSR